MICAQLHRSIDSFNRSYALRVDADRLVDHRNQDPVYNETSGFLNLDRGLSDLLRNLLYRLNRFGRRIQSGNYLYQLHNRSRIEEMHSHHMAVDPGTDFRNGKGRRIGCKDAFRLADRFQLFKGLLLDLHVLNGSLYDQVAVSADILYARCDLGKDLVRLFLGHFSFRDPFLESLGNFIFSVCGKCLIDIAQHNLVAFCLCKRLCNAGTHGSGADNANLHGRTSLFSSQLF